MICYDPGKNGGIAKLFRDGSITAITMPGTQRGVYETLKPLDSPDGAYTPAEHLCSFEPIIYIEDLVKFTGRPMPSSRMAVYAGSYYYALGVCTALKYRIVTVPPKKWQQALGLGDSKSHPTHNAWKNHLKNRAEQLFPNIKVTLATADALLILEAARRGLIG